VNNSATNNPIPRHSLLGFSVNPGTLDDYLNLITHAIDHKQSHTVLYHNLHSLYSYFTSESLQVDYGDCTVLVDGMPVIWLMQACGVKVTREHRLTYVDFIMPMMKHASTHGLRVFHVGQQKHVQQTALKRIRDEVPGIQIAGHDGYFDQSTASSDSQAVIDEINNFNADIVLVGFGAPKQEAWLSENRTKIDASIVFACGACMEYVAGAVKTPPRWMGRTGLEWLFRLGENPRRFAFRYLVEPLLLAGILARQWLSSRRLSNPS